jgi:hypothetical protein
MFSPAAPTERGYVLADFSFPLNRFHSKKILPGKALVNMTQTDVLSTDVFFPRMFCPHGCFVLTDVLSAGRLVRRSFCPSGRFVPTDVLFPRTFFHGRFVSGRFVSGRFVWAPDKRFKGKTGLRTSISER